MVVLSKQPPKDKSLDLSSVLFAMPAGSTVPSSLYEDLKQFFPSLVAVGNDYGITEFTSACVTISFDSNYGMGSVGPSMAIKVIDLETNEPCGANEVGEITVIVPIALKGYLNRPEATANLFGPDGFIRTHNLGSYNELGKLVFECHNKELIKYKNILLYPLEIENIINSHPDVIDVGVFGRTEPTVQELVTAVVVKKINSTLTEEDIVDLVDKSVSDDEKKLRGGVKFVERLPKNPQGKLLRRKLLESYENINNNKAG